MNKDDHKLINKIKKSKYQINDDKEEEEYFVTPELNLKESTDNQMNSDKEEKNKIKCQKYKVNLKNIGRNIKPDSVTNKNTRQEKAQVIVISKKRHRDTAKQDEFSNYEKSEDVNSDKIGGKFSISESYQS